MIGLKLPRLFYGRKKRQQIIGVRADFCEFCAGVCRHWVISFQSAPTVFFVPLTFDEYSRESRCEICRTQFPISELSPIQRLSAPEINRPGQPVRCGISISKLITETNPEVVERATIEVHEMVSHPGGPELIKKNRVIHFLCNHQLEYRRRMRSFMPQLAIGSIQAAIVGFALSAMVHSGLAWSFAGSLFLFLSLYAWMVLRQRLDRELKGAALKLCAITGITPEKMLSKIDAFAERFPFGVFLVRQQMVRQKMVREEMEPGMTFESGEDFVSLLELSGQPDFS